MEAAGAVLTVVPVIESTYLPTYLGTLPTIQNTGTGNTHKSGRDEEEVYITTSLKFCPYV